MGPVNYGERILLAEMITERKARVGITGVGYVGLPLALTVADAGYSVTAFDVDSAKVEQLNSKKSYIEYIPDSAIAKQIDANRFEATSDFERLNEPDIILICVPTPLGDHSDPDLGFVIETARSIAKRLRSGQLEPRGQVFVIIFMDGPLSRGEL